MPPAAPLARLASRLRSASLAPALLVIALLAYATSARAQVWNETGDAGDLPGTAQVTAGSGPLTEIDGNLATDTDVDMYCIHVTDPVSFSANLQCVVITGPDLWIFNSAGLGVSASFLCQTGYKFVTGAFANTPGTYYLAVSYHGIAPLAGANPIWLASNLADHAPDGPGAGGAVTSWGGTATVQPLNPYRIVLFGAAFCEAATPARGRSWGALKTIYR